MNTQTNTNEGKKKKRLGLKIFIVILIIIIALPTAAFFIVPAYISSDGGTNMIIGKINNAIDGKVEMEDLKMGWFSGVQLTDLKYADNAGTTSVNVKGISTKPNFGSLIKGEVSLGKTVIDQPEVVITVDKSKMSEPQKSTGTTTSKSPADTKSSGGIIIPDVELEVVKGNVTVNLKEEDLIESVQFKDIASRFDINPLGQTSTFELGLAMVGDDDGESRISANGNVTTAKPDSEKGWTLKGTNGDFNINIDNLELGTLRPLMAMAGQDVDVSGKLNADMVATVKDGGLETVKANAVLDGFKSMTEGKEMVLDEPVKLKAEISTANDTIKIDAVDVSSSFCNLKATGGMEKVDYTADVDLKGLTEFAGQFADLGKYALTGKLGGKGSVSLDEDGTGVYSDLKLENFVLGNTESKKATSPTDITVRGSFKAYKETNRISSESFKIISNPVTMQISGNFGGEAESSLTANGDVDLGQLRPFLVVAGAIPEDTIISGRANTLVSVNTSGDNVQVKTNNTEITNLRIKKTDQADAFEEAIIKLSTDITANTKEKTLAINTLSVDSTNIKVTKGTLTQAKANGKTDLKGQFEAEYDLAGVSQVASAFMPENLNLEGKRKAVLNFASSYAEDQKNGMLANMNADLAFGFDKAEYLGLEIGKADFDVRMTKGILNIEPFTTTANNGRLNFAGSVNFNDEKPALKIPGPMQVIDNVQVNDTVSKNFLVYLNPLFAGATNVRGVANLRCDELSIPMNASNVDDIVVDGAIGIDSLRMEMNNKTALGSLLHMALPLAGIDTSNLGANMKLVNTDFLVKDSIAKYDNMQINFNRYPLNFKGQMGIDVKNPGSGKDRINMNIYLPITSKGYVTVDNANASGRIPVVLGGLTLKPELNLAKAREEIIKSLAANQVGNLIRDAIGVEEGSGEGSLEEQIIKEGLRGLFGN